MAGNMSAELKGSLIEGEYQDIYIYITKVHLRVQEDVAILINVFSFGSCLIIR